MTFPLWSAFGTVIEWLIAVYLASVFVTINIFVLAKRERIKALRDSIREGPVGSAGGTTGGSTPIDPR